MIYVAVDPSFTRTGLCILDTKRKTIYFKPISPPGTNKTYSDTINRSLYVLNNIFDSFHLHELVTLLIEEPMVSSIKASSLGVLSGVLTSHLVNHEIITKLYTANPNTIRQLNSALPNKNEVSKKALSKTSVELILKLFEEIGYTITLWTDKPRKRQICHDEAESFMLLLLMLFQDNILTEQFKQKIYNIHKGYYVKKIKLNELNMEVN